jgi:hypothetical protein
MHKFGWFSFQKTYSPFVEQVYFQVFFPSVINIGYISISFCSTDGHTFSGAIICMKFNGFQAFLRKRSQCSQIRNNLRFFLFWYTWHLFYFPITQIKLLSRHILDQENFWACLCTQPYLVLYRSRIRIQKMQI